MSGRRTRARQDMTGGGQPVDDPFADDALSELREIRERLQPLGVLEGLSPEHQFMLADRVCLCDAAYRRFEGHPVGDGGDSAFIRAQKVYRQKTPAQVKRLNRKLRALRQAADALITEVKKIRTSANGYLAYQIDTRSVPVSLEDLDFVPQGDHLARLLCTIDLIQFPPDDASQAPTAGSVPSEDVVKDQSVRALYLFFTHECGRVKNDAEVRVAEIGNQFWSWNVDVTEHYSQRKAKGCPAIRQWLRRTRRSMNT